ncbi:RAMP superfamily CRISPR-associated protein [Candidatus Entotheonella palauensis]|uniref:CRISPR type III-associated protein domain-containing protein n=1 Tax=Candidatus Entotheonella gemina TaxID=1429439 RepID=W4LZL7_9BACT|nr:RAMP superfamily CRISPR-associated protein [Candidatus Entotheonella palauensis]ETX03370.1 MAG: hypothetical protein ETSY2_33650 [Candidatus Entotheonella gemina]
MGLKNRWRIDGSLTTRSPLHLGSGDFITRPALLAERRENGQLRREPIQIAAVTTDCRQRAYIPGKTLKGVLRAWLDKRGIAAGLVEQVFGSPETAEELDAFGGKAEFGDAFASVPQAMPWAPYACAERLTGVQAAVAIDRQTRTAYAQKLFHKEFVPPGVIFDLTITGQDVEPEELQLLLYALDQFNQSGQCVVIGAETGNGFGRLHWETHRISRLDQDQIKQIDEWLTRDDEPVGYAGYPALSDAACRTLADKAKAAFQADQPASLTLALSIAFNGPFLVNDPSRYQSKSDPAHSPLRDHLGRVILPASSIRGALRSQAERIVRTFHPAAACHATNRDTACQPIDEAKARETLCLTCQLFGAPGWRAPVSFSDFVLSEDRVEVVLHQEFLAIDRFMGGGADQLKFNAQAAYQPVLTGHLSLDLKRLDAWALGLLALVIRDLMEGDIALGFGAAKGYGACRATLTGLKTAGLEQWPALWNLLQACEADEIDWNRLDLASLPNSEFEYIAVDDILQRLLSDFRNRLDTYLPQAPRTGEPHAVS